MSWKERFQIADLDDNVRIEIKCRKCGHIFFETAKKLKGHPHLAQKFLDEYEIISICRKWNCSGTCYVACPSTSPVEGFVGGLT